VAPNDARIVPGIIQIEPQRGGENQEVADGSRRPAERHAERPAERRGVHRFLESDELRFEKALGAWEWAARNSISIQRNEFMTGFSRFVVGTAVLSVWATCGMVSQALADGYGTVTGQFVLDGPIPTLKPLVSKGDTTVKDGAVCGKDGVADESLVVDPATKGIANVFVYMPKAPKDIFPGLKESKEKIVKFDQQGCHFIPHALILRTDQTIAILSGDPILHNTDVVAVRNTGQNQTISMDRVGTTQWKFPQAERMPTMVKCDIHPWMRAWWLIIDHPYAAISGKDGKFTIEKVPAGTQEFTAWQDANDGRWVFGKTRETRVIKVKVEPDKTTSIGVIKIPAG
jgi:hypothetical protein